MPSSVNSQVIDAVTSTSAGVLGQSASQSMGLVYQVMAQAVGGSMQNATSVQYSMAQVNTALIATACSRILSIGPNAGLPAPTPPPAPAPSPPVTPLTPLKPAEDSQTGGTGGTGAN